MFALSLDEAAHPCALGLHILQDFQFFPDHNYTKPEASRRELESLSHQFSIKD